MVSRAIDESAEGQGLEDPNIQQTPRDPGQSIDSNLKRLPVITSPVLSLVLESAPGSSRPDSQTNWLAHTELATAYREPKSNLGIE